MHLIREKLIDELHEFEKKIKSNPTAIMSAQEIERLRMILSSIKNIDKIEMYEDSGYSEARRRDSMGRYAKDGERIDRHRRYGGYDGYVEDDGKHEMINHLRNMLDRAENSKEREAIKRCIHELEE